MPTHPYYIILPLVSIIRIWHCNIMKHKYEELLNEHYKSNAKQKHLGCKKRRGQSEAAVI